jgi:hypothetical protein
MDLEGSGSVLIVVLSGICPDTEEMHGNLSVWPVSHPRIEPSASRVQVWSVTAMLTRYKQTLRPESASELYRPSDRRLWAKLLPTFADRGVSRSQRGGSSASVISVF